MNQKKKETKRMETTLEPKTNPTPKTLAVAKDRLAELQRAGAKLGIQLPPSVPPKTLDSARRLIVDIERQLALAGATASVIPVTALASNQPAPAPMDSASLFAKAGAIAAKCRQAAACPPESRPSRPMALEDMTRSELVREIENEKSHERRAELFAQLKLREKGEPRRCVIERTANWSDLQLSRAIEASKGAERSELFTILRRREEYRRNH